MPPPVTQDWWVMAPAAASQGSNLHPVTPAGTIIIATDKGSAEDKAIAAIQDVTIGGQQYKRFMGPFASQQIAQKASPPSGLQFIGTAIGIIGTNAATAVGGNIPSLALGSNINDFLSRLTSLNTWIRVGEFILGALLLVSGALHLTGSSADLKDIAKLTPAGKLL